MRPVGYYIHHRGRGHFDRARLVASRLHRPCTLIGTLPTGGEGFDRLALPDDSGGEYLRSARPDGLPHAFHFAPVDFLPVRERMALIAAWITSHTPALTIVDVSVEIALMCRLLSVPTIVIRLAGDRTDPAHLESFRAAERLIAPFPAAFEHAATPAWVKDKTYYAGFIHARAAAAAVSVVPKTVSVILGEGGSQISAARVAAAAAATPDHTWHVYGRADVGADVACDNLHWHGFVSDLEEALASTDVLIGAAGDGVVSQAVRHRKRFVCFPQARPYDEQAAKARVLDERRAAIVLAEWPDPKRWPSVLAAAHDLNTAAIASFGNDDPLAGLTAMIERTASLFDP